MINKETTFKSNSQNLNKQLFKLIKTVDNVRKRGKCSKFNKPAKSMNMNFKKFNSRNFYKNALFYKNQKWGLMIKMFKRK